jgi:Skp family chaperone for outer membrane proteins
LTCGEANAQAISGISTAFRTSQAVEPPKTPVLQFPDGAKLAYVDLDKVAALSGEGKVAATKLEALRSKKSEEVSERGRQVESLQQKLLQGAALLNDDARAQLQRAFERAQIDFQRFAQDAEAEFRNAQQQVQVSFTRRLFPVIGEVAKEKDLWAVFSVDSLLWANTALDLSEEVAKRLDAAAKTSR